jgi:hypothetical protein
VTGRLMAQPMYTQFRKYPLRSGTYVSCHKETSRQLHLLRAQVNYWSRRPEDF